MIKKPGILVVQGGAEGAYAEDALLADFVRTLVLDPTDVAYPKLEGLERLEDWPLVRHELGKAILDLAEGGLVVGHSLGGAAILKLLSEDGTARPIKGLFLVAMPYVCWDGEWGTGEFAIDNGFAARLPDCGDIRLYHSQDDAVVPVSHVHRYAEKLTKATVTIVDGYGHQFTSKPFRELAEDLTRQLSRQRP